VQTCLPWWHDTFAPLSTGSNRPQIKSGCRTVNGNVACSPEAMRASAEAEMRRLGYWKKAGAMPLAVYTLARYASSEVGSGPPEEKVAVMEAAINRALGTSTTRGWYPAGNINNLLLYRQSSTSHPNYGWYGPIHDSGGKSPYGRWAATSKDPGVDDLLIADFVLAGKSKNFARGAVTQYGPEHLTDPRSSVPVLAKDGNYWVGPLPGVDHWRTFLYMQDKTIAPSSPLGQQLIAAAQAALAKPIRRPDWSGLSVCRRGFLGRVPGPVYALAGVGLAVGAWYYLSRTRRQLALAPPAPRLKERYAFDPWTSEAQKQRLAQEFMSIRSKKIREFIPDELPVHVYPFAEYMRRVSDHDITPREVAKAYIMTVGSMRRSAIGAKKVRARWRDYPGPKTGKVRPEDVLGELLKSPVGQQYLDAAERGQFDTAAARSLSKKFGAWGFEPTFHKQLKTAVTLADDAPAINRVLKRGSRAAWYNYVTKKISGVSLAKAGFLASLMGRGDIATADARELNFWMCATDKWQIAKKTCERPLASKFDDGELVDENFMDLFNKKMSSIKMSMPAKYKPFYLHLAHHALWDRIGDTKTTHSQIIDAMENA